jgi:Tfp pilus assembly protein PilO
MKNASVLVQVALLLIAISLLFFYVRPAFSNISTDQDRVSEYNEAITQASELNSLLQNLQSQIDNLPRTDRAALETYLPETIDGIKVQRAIKAYVDRRELELDALGQGDRSEFGESGYLNQMTFNVTVRGDYSEVKDFLRDTERNPYPLHVTNLAITPLGSDGSRVSAEVTFATYEFVSTEN